MSRDDVQRSADRLSALFPAEITTERLSRRVERGQVNDAIRQLTLARFWFGEDHLDTARLRLRLVRAYLLEQQPEVALEHVNRVARRLDAARAGVPVDLVLAVHVGLGESRLMLGDVEGAREALGLAQRVAESTLAGPGGETPSGSGRDQPRAAVDSQVELYEALAMLAAADSDASEAFEMWTRVWEATEADPDRGPQDVSMVKVYVELARCQTQLGRYEEAEMLAKRALEIAEKNGDPECSLVSADAAEAAAEALRQQGRVEDSLAFLERAIATHAGVSGRSSPGVVRLRQEAAAAHIALDAYGPAAEQLRMVVTCLEHQCAVTPDRGSLLEAADNQRRLAEVYQLDGLNLRAVAALQASHAHLARALGHADERTRDALRRLKAAEASSRHRTPSPLPASSPQHRQMAMQQQ